MLKRLIVSVFVVGLLNSAIAGPVESAAKAARGRRTSNALLCGPKADAAAGVVALSEAVKNLKDKSSIKLQPGNYGSTLIEIKADEIMIEGVNPEECCDVEILLTGNDCIVKNIYLKSVIAPGEVTIVDSRFKEITLRPDYKKSVQVVFNCYMNHIFVDPSCKKIYLKNITVAHDKYGLEIGSMKDPNTGKAYEGKLFITDSVICGNDGGFYIYTGDFKKLESLFSNCLFHGGKALLIYSALKKEYPKMKELSRILKKNKVKGKVWVKDPEFEDPEGFVLSKKSKGFKKRWGVKLNKKMVPVP